MPTKSRGFRLLPLVMLALILLFQMLWVTYNAVQKKGYDLDEIFTYTLSNAYFSGLPHEAENMFDTWHTGAEIQNLLVPGKNTFAYASVYDNQESDVHPPLYYLLQHTLASFFPLAFSKWLGIVPNMVYFVISALILYRLADRISGNAWDALLICTVWGFSPQAAASVLFIRMYALLTVFCLWQAELYSRLIFDVKVSRASWFQIGLCTFLGFMTHYYFLVFLFFMFAVTAAVLLAHRRFTVLLRLAGAHAAGGVVGVIFFPACIYQWLYSSRGSDTRASLKKLFDFNILKGYLRLLSQDLFGNRLVFFGLLLFSICLLYLLFAFWSKQKTITLSLANLRSACHTPKAAFTVTLMLTSGFYVAVIALVSPFVAARYLFCIGPLLLLGYIQGLLLLVGRLHIPKAVFRTALVVCFLSLNIIVYRQGALNYLLDTHDAAAKSLAQRNNAPVSAVWLGNEKDYTMNYYLDELAQYEHVLFTDMTTLFMDGKSSCARLIADEHYVFYVDKTVDQNLFLTEMQAHGFIAVEKVFSHPKDQVYWVSVQ